MNSVFLRINLFLSLWLVGSTAFGQSLEEKAWSAFNKGQYTLAHEVIDSWMTKEWENPNPHALRAKVYFAQKNYVKALEKFSYLLRINSTNIDYLTEKARVHMAKGELLSAISLIQKAKIYAPNEPHLWRLHIELLLRTENENYHRLAHTMQKKAIKMFPKEDWDYKDIEYYGKNAFEKARQAVNLGNYSKADEFLRLSLAENKNDPQARLLYAKNLFQLNRLDDSLQEYEKLILKDKNNIEYLVGKAKVLIQQRQYVVALAVLERARTLNDTDEQLWQLMVEVLDKFENRNIKQLVRKVQTIARHRFPGSRWDFSPIKTDSDVSANNKSTSFQIELGAMAESVSRSDKTDAAGFQFGNNDSTDLGQYIGGNVTFARGTSLYGYFTNQNSFSYNDRIWMAGLYQPVSNRIFSLLEYTYSPTRFNEPLWSLLAQLKYSSDWDIHVYAGVKPAQWAVYGYEGVVSIEYVLNKSTGLSYTYTRGDFRSEFQKSLHNNHKISTYYYYTANNFIAVSADVGGFNDSTWAQKELIFNGFHGLSKTWALVYEFGGFNQQNNYLQTWSSLGLRYTY